MVLILLGEMGEWKVTHQIYDSLNKAIIR